MVLGGCIMTLFHFVGIKGSGMSSLAQILHDSSQKVQGSDVEKYFLRKSHYVIGKYQSYRLMKIIYIQG